VANETFMKKHLEFWKKDVCTPGWMFSEFVCPGLDFWKQILSPSYIFMSFSCLYSLGVSLFGFF
jgi:hypothetical protein